MANPVVVHSKQSIAARKRKVFLKVLADTASVAAAAKACGYQDATTLQAYRRDNEDFAEEWNNAMEAAATVLEAEMVRRAVDGVMEPVFFKGTVVGHIRKYSDTLLQFALRGMRPEVYRENARGGNLNVNFGIAVMPMTAKNDDAWEDRALEMHGGQTLVQIEAKPTENAMLRVKRGD